MVVRDMEQTCFHAIVISSDKIIGRLLRHVAGGDRNILIPGDVDAFTVVMFIVDTAGDGEPGYVPLAVIHYKMNIRREDRLGIVIDRDCRIRPPEKCLRQVRPVVELSADLNVRLVRIQGK